MRYETQRLRPPGFEPPGSGFDTATQVAADGRKLVWSREQFKGLPLLDRVRLLAGGNVHFFRGSVEVPAREALRDL
jgi:hypothetical protein